MNDVELLWFHPPVTMDFVNIGNMNGAIHDWPKLMEQAYRCVSVLSMKLPQLTTPPRSLKPGGWIEVHDMDWTFRSQGGTVTPEYAPLKTMQLVHQGLAALDIEFDSARKHFHRLNETGFTNANTRNTIVPVGSWPQKRKLKELGAVCVVFTVRALQAMTLGPLTRGLGWTVEEVERFCADAEKDLRSSLFHPYVTHHAFWAQKPY